MIGQKVLESLLQGTLLLTATRRSATHLLNDYHDAQKRQNKQAWPCPKIFTLNDWLKAQWADLGLIQNVEKKTFPLLLTEWQAQQLWENIIQASSWGQNLLQVTSTAQSAMQAWDLLKRWQLPLAHPDIQQTLSESKDIEAFVEWATAYELLLQENHWCDKATMITFLPVPKVDSPIIWLVGFDDLPPQYRDYFEQCQQANICVEEIVPYESQTNTVNRLLFENPTLEFQAMAQWAKALLEKNEPGPIAIVLPELANYRQELIEIFDKTFMPYHVLQAERVVSEDYNISAGEPLKTIPIVVAAFQALNLLKGKMTTSDLTFLLRTPFLLENHQNASNAGILSNAFFERNQGSLTLSEVQTILQIVKDKIEGKTAFESWFQSIEQVIKQKPVLKQKRLYAEWAIFFRKFLEKLNWPGARALNSIEHQAVKRFDVLLNGLGQFDVIQEKVNYLEALNQLLKMASFEIFQPETRQVKMDILGILEASSLPFKHLWIGGLHSQTWPPLPTPNPFIPLSLQRKLEMPHASSEREHRFSKSVLQGLIGSAENVIVSAPLSDNVQTLGASQLIRDYPLAKLNEIEPFVNKDTVEGVGIENIGNRGIQKAGLLEPFYDETGPKVTDSEKIAGGSTLLRLQASCPFRAFAEKRLNVTRSEQVVITGLPPAKRGILLHEILQVLWLNIRDKETLEALSEEALTQKIHSTSKRVVENYAKADLVQPDFVWQIELDRIIHILKAYFDLERSRASFSVEACEKTLKVQLGELFLTVRLDRVDRLASGEYVVLDYKTGVVRLSDVLGDRPNLPQLPLYCLFHEKTSGMCFVELRSEGCQFLGISESTEGFPGIKSVDSLRMKDKPESWNALVSHWEGVLLKLSKGFMAGNASVDPKEKNACLYCELSAFCRISEKLCR